MQLQIEINQSKSKSKSSRFGKPISLSCTAGANSKRKSQQIQTCSTSHQKAASFENKNVRKCLRKHKSYIQSKPHLHLEQKLGSPKLLGEWLSPTLTDLEKKGFTCSNHQSVSVNQSVNTTKASLPSCKAQGTHQLDVIKQECLPFVRN